MGLHPPYATEYPSLVMDNVTPRAFAETWAAEMNSFGGQIKQAAEDIVQMLSLGLGVKDELIKASEYGPHLLAPTATDLIKYGQAGSIFAGFHTDLNAITVHGRSRYSVGRCSPSHASALANVVGVQGLHIWARNGGKRINVSIPAGHLLVQAGKQLEYVRCLSVPSLAF